MRTGVNTRNYPNYQLKYDARQLRNTFTVSVKISYVYRRCVFIGFR